MCDRLRCEKTGQPVDENCEDCLIPADGPDPGMFLQAGTMMFI